MSEDHHNQNEALLRLNIINGENLKFTTFLGKFKSFILIWIDPRFKQTTKTLTTTTKHPTYNHHLTFPLSLETLQNLNSRVTFQLVSPSSPITHKRVIGSTSMLIADVKFQEEVFTLQLWRPSGRAHGLIRVSAMVEINLGCYTQPQPPPQQQPVGCVTGIPVQVNHIQSPPLELSYTHHNVDVVPSAPPEDLSVESEYSVETNTKNAHLEPLDVDCNSLTSCDCSSSSTVSNGCNKVAAGPSDGPNVLRSLLVGFLGGAVAVATVLVGSNTG